MEKVGEYGVNTFYLFEDIKAAYDSSDRNELFKAVEEFSLPGKLRRLVEVSLENIRHKVKTQNGISAVARREVFVSVSAFKPKVKNVSPRAWTEPIAVLLLLS
jgi:hypothetical protein